MLKFNVKSVAKTLLFALVFLLCLSIDNTSSVPAKKIIYVDYKPERPKKKERKKKKNRKKKATRRNKKSVRKKGKVLNTKEAFIKRYIKKVMSLSPDFVLKVNKSVIPNVGEDFNTLRKEFTTDPYFNEVSKYARFIHSSLDCGKYWKIFVKAEYDITAEGVNRILSNKQEIIDSEKALVSAIAQEIDRMNENFTVLVENRLAEYCMSRSYRPLMKKLLKIPGTKDILWNKDTVQILPTSYKSYSEWNVKITYHLTKEEKEIADQFVKDWVATYISPAMSDARKARIINDFMVKQYKYSYGDNGEEWYRSGANSMDAKLGKYNVHSSYALVFENGGVCEANSSLFYKLAKQAGLDVKYVSGKSRGEGHAWNMVKVDGTWYHNDVTWNRGHYTGDPEKAFFLSKQYYLKGDKTMSADHEWDRRKHPEAPFDFGDSESRLTSRKGKNK